MIDKNSDIKETECMYIHLQKRYMNNETKNINKFLIISNRFIDVIDVDKNFIIKNSKDRIFYKRYIKTKRSWNKRKNKIYNIFKRYFRI